MQRFVYAPRVEAYVALENTGSSTPIIDISEDIISGTIIRRVDAMSEASLTLQNKHGRYTRPQTAKKDGDPLGEGGTLIQPMDRIHIRMSRVGEPMAVFSGYVDSAPHYQLYSGPVVLRASCSLKRLQHTYFDPGLPAITQLFQKYGFTYNSNMGQFTSNPADQVLNLDASGSMKTLIEGILTEIGHWPEKAIDIRMIPSQFITNIAALLTNNKKEMQEDYKRIMKTLVDLFAIDESQLMVQVGGIGSGGSASPVHGNVSAKEVASMLIDTGLNKDLIVSLVAIAGRESGYISDNINFNGGGDASSNDGSYDFGLFQFNTVHAENAENGGKGLSGPASGASLNELKEYVKKQPQWVQDFYEKMSDPRLASAKAARFAAQDPSLGAWKGLKDISDADIATATAAVDAAYQDRNVKTPPPDRPTGVDEGTGGPKPNMSYSFRLTHPTTGLDETDGGSPGNGLWGACDFMTDAGTKVLAVEDGKITGIGSSTPGQSIHFTGNSSQEYWYGHTTSPAPPGNYKAGDVIGLVFDQGDNSHLHLALHGYGYGTGAPYKSTDGPVVTVAHPPLSNLKSNSGELPDVGGDVVGGIGSGDGPTQIGVGAIADIARQVQFFQFSTGAFDNIASNILTGQRALANDISLMEWMSNIVKASGRVFMSKPDGDYLAFFPDYFGYYGTVGGGQSATWFLSEIEIIDLTIENSDIDLTTHVFGVAPVVLDTMAAIQNSKSLNLLYSTMATIEDPAFTWFMAVDEAGFSPREFMRLYGARPLIVDLPFISQRELVWMATWMEFAKMWSKRFAAQASFTFMPEIQPGWLLNIGNRIQMYVESVTHTFSYESGFTTSAELSSAATLSDNIDWLPRVGVNAGVSPTDPKPPSLPEGIQRVGENGPHTTTTSPKVVPPHGI